MAFFKWLTLVVVVVSVANRPSAATVQSSDTLNGPWFVVEPPAWLEFTNQTGAVVSCVGAGHPAPTVTWIDSASLASSSSSGASGSLMELADLRRTVTSSSGDNATLVFPPFAATSYRPDVHSTTYRCRASSPAGTILSREMRLRTVLVQSYETQAVAGSAVLGGVALLRCAIPPAIKNDVQVTSWLQEFTGVTIYPSLQGDGKHHMLPVSGDLYLYGVDKGDSRTGYRCRTRHRFGHSSVAPHQLSSNAASVTVSESTNVFAPTINAKMTSVQVALGENVAVPCVAQGFPVPTIRWYRLEPDRPPISMDEQTASFGVLVLENAQMEDSATYRCEATNSAGQSAPYDVRLEVVEPLRVQLQPDGPVLRVNQGHVASIQCSFNLDPPASHHYASTANGLAGHSSGPASRPVVKWLKDGVAVSTTSTTGHPKYQQTSSSPSPGQQLWTLRISSMQRSDQGVYQCFVYTERESAQSSIRLLLGDAPPQLVHHFNEQTLVPGPFVTLRCSAIGNPPPDMIWLLDNQPLVNHPRISMSQLVSATGETTGHLNITNVQVEDGGEYVCLAKNHVGEALHSSRLNIYGLPFIRPIPKLTAVADADVSVKCPVAGYPIMEIMWTKGDDVLRSGTKYTLDHQTGTLTIHSVSQTTDKGVYTCAVRDRQGHSARRDFTIDVVVAPKMTPFQQMDPSGLKVGERLTLTCSVTKGDLPLSFSWTVDGQPVKTGPVRSVQIDPFTNLLSVDSLQAGHSGNYTCNVRNTATTAVAQQQQSQLVLIQVPPRIDAFVQPDDQILKQGIRTRLLCGVSQGDKPLDFSWEKDGRPLSQTGLAVARSDDVYPLVANGLLLPLPAVTIRQVDADSSVLTFTNLSAVHSGRYQCAARNAAGVARQTAHLHVQVPPYWIVEPRDATVLVGQPLMVHCQADGYPKPNVTWSRTFDSHQESTLLNNRTSPGLLKLLHNGTLVIRSARKSLQGRYQCRAVNRIGQDVTATVSITVHAGPKFGDSLSRLAVKKETTASFQCRVDGDSPLHLAWRRSSSSSSLLSTNYRIRIQEKEASNGIVSILTIPSTQIEDTGIYICIASNSHGQVERDFQLSVLEPPEQPRHLQVQETSSRRVTLSWLPPPSSNALNPLIAYVVQYREANHASTWQETDNLSVYSTTYSLEGLEPSSQYQARVLAETSAGRGPPSEIVAVATYGEPPGTSPSDLRAVSISSTSIRLSWTAINRNSWHSNLIGYHLGFRQDNAMSYNFTTVPLMDQQSSGQLDMTLIQLRKATKFLFVIRAFNRYGEGSLSPPTSAVTLEDAPTASPQSLRCSTSSWQSIEVTWQAPPVSEQNGHIQHYRVHYEWIAPMLADQLDDSPQVKTVDGIYITLSGLLPHSAYRIRVEAVTRVGSGPLSAPVTCITDETVPKAPTEVKAFTSGPNAVTLCWPSPTHGEILHYTLNIKPGGHGSSNTQRHTVAGTQSHYVVESLGVTSQPSFYEIWMTASNRIGVGEKSKSLRFTPSYKPNNLAICSFGRRVVQPWKTSIDLPCQVIGNNAAQPVWTFNGKPIGSKLLVDSTSDGDVKAGHHHNNKTGQMLADGQLTLNDLKRSDTGNYTCLVKTGYVSDSIHYQLIVIVPPTPPTLHVFQTTAAQIQIQWKTEDDGGSPVRGFLVHWRHADGGDWEERELDRQATSTLLQDLRCGTRYQIYLTAFNLVGTSGPSNVILARTKGDAPLVPALASSALSANSTHVTVFLNGWQERGCPIRSYGIDYKMDGEAYWTTVSDDVQNLPVVFIEDVQPSSAYQIKIRARTSNGDVTVEYDLVTLDHTGQTPSPDRINRAGRQLVTSGNADSGHVVLPWWLIGAVSAVGTASLLGLVVACSCLYKTRNESRRLVASALPSESTLADGPNANTWNKSHKSGSTGADRTTSSKRSSTYELQSMDKMSNYSDHDDIYPYATFELHRDHPRSPVKMLDQPPDFSRLKYGHHLGHNHLKLPLRPPPTWSELSTIEIERHFQGSPTVSDSDLESLPVPDYHERGTGRRQGGFITGVIHQPKDYASKSSLKRFSSKSNGDATMDSSDELHQRTLPKQYQRPSHPVPPKKLPLLRLVDQSNLWSGQHQQPAVPSASWTRPETSASSGFVHRPKASKNGLAGTNSKRQHAESPNDHSIAV